jgi:hypothetical protein
VVQRNPEDAAVLFPSLSLASVLTTLDTFAEYFHCEKQVSVLPGIFGDFDAHWIRSCFVRKIGLRDVASAGYVPLPMRPFSVDRVGC